MKTALVLTTINVPTVLSLYRRCNDRVHFYIVGDRKTPDAEVVKFLEDVPNHSYYGYDWQAQLGYKCHDWIGPNSLSRRNIGFLEALKAGADVIVSIDDDNIPINYFDYFNRFAWTVGHPFQGIKLTGTKGWLDPGQLLVPMTKHRGYPASMPRTMVVQHVETARVGVVAGLVLGDPDIDAVTRIATSPDIQQVSVLGHAGAVVDLHNWTVFNSQNTAVVRDLVPAWFMMPGVGRHDDIYASLIVQRVARERGLHVHFGQPFTYQQRNEHDLLVDLRAEISGMENVVKLAELLDSIILPGKNVIDDTRKIYQTLLYCSFLPETSVRAGLAFLDDCESVL